MKNVILSIILLLPFLGMSQHTFSIVAVDSITGEIGSAGATCGDSIIWPGTPGAMLISDIIPGIGAIHTQSYYDLTNQINARNRMNMGDSPDEIIAWLEANDINSNPGIRQYGVVDYNGGSPRSAAYTGAGCFDYKNHILGSNYAIQGNILLGQQILDSMEHRFNTTDGCLSDKLMAAMQGANVVGADTRCAPEGTSSLSAFLRVAKANDDPNDIYIDINIAGTNPGVEPIDELQTKYDFWKNNNNHVCSPVVSNKDLDYLNETIVLYPNPTDDIVHIKGMNTDVSNIVITDVLGNKIGSIETKVTSEEYHISFATQPRGIYFLTFWKESQVVATKKITIH